MCIRDKSTVFKINAYPDLTDTGNIMKMKIYYTQSIYNIQVQPCLYIIAYFKVYIVQKTGLFKTEETRLFKTLRQTFFETAVVKIYQ